MEIIEWDPSFSVGIERLDEQHKRIIGMINGLASESRATGRSMIITEMLIRLTSFANDHFRAEEDLLEKHGYPDLGRQKEAHSAFCNRLMTFFGEPSHPSESVPKELLRFLHDWWVGHILETDMAYRPFLEARGAE